MIVAVVIQFVAGSVVSLFYFGCDGCCAGKSVYPGDIFFDCIFAGGSFLF